MECLKEILPVILYVLLGILLIVLIILAIRAFRTLKKVDEVVGNVNDKMQRVDGFLDSIDSSIDMVSTIGNKIASFLSTGIISSIVNLIKSRKNNKGESDENE